MPGRLGPRPAPAKARAYRVHLFPPALRLRSKRLNVGICQDICHAMPMNAFRRIKLFKNGRNQAVRIPREFELPGEDAIIRREGDKLIIEAAPPQSLLALLAEMSPIEESFPDFDDEPPSPVSL